jgi:hypothetical protein
MNAVKRQVHNTVRHTCFAKTIYIYRLYRFFGWGVTEYNVIYSVYIYTVLANPKHTPNDGALLTGLRITHNARRYLV